MGFALNEAPNIALDILQRHKYKRGCGVFWSWIWCPCTLGGSLGWYGNECDFLESEEIPDSKHWSACCYPENLDVQSDAALKALKDSLKMLLIKTNNIPKDSIEDLTNKMKHIIEQQVSNTIKVLETSLNQKTIVCSYTNHIERALTQIKTRAIHEERLCGRIDEKIPITGYSINIPHYGLHK